jgi:type I restriction enzyme S subunit
MNNLPKLRFPEFWDAGEWEEKKLGEIAALITEKTGNKKYTLMSINAGVGLVSQIEKFGREIAGNSYKNYFVIRENDFAYNKSATKDYPEGFIAMHSSMELAAVPNSIFTCFRTQENKVYPQYLNYLFLCNLHGKWLKQFISVGARAHGSLNIDNKYLLLLPIPLPKGESSLSEQQKIADCLSSIDDRITLETQKLDTLKAHKKGLMQQLFPAEGETLPKLRFPEFWDAGEWVLKNFSKYIVLYRGSSPRPIQSYLTSDSSGVNWIKIGDTKFAKNFIISQVEERITTKGAEKSRRVNVGELILANSMSYGKTYQVAIDGYIYDGWFVLRDYEEYFDKQFLLQLLNSEYMQNQYKRFSAGGIVQNISSDIVYKTVLPHTSLKEQQKIADCLSSIDEAIAAQSQAIDLLKLHKKGLMQQLFPSVEEVRG